MRSDRHAMRAKMRSTLLGAAASIGLTSSLLPSVARAVDRTWDGASSNNFSLNTNWTANVTPISTDNAVFRNQAGIGRSVVIMDANRTVAAMSIDGTPSVGAYEFQKTSSNLLTVTGNLLIGNNGLGATPVTFNGFNVSAANVIPAGTSVLSLTNGAQVTCGSQFTTQNSATANITGSTVTAPIFGALASASTVNVNAGAAVNATSILQIETGSRVNVNGGVVNMAGSLLSGGTLTLNSGGTINLTGGAFDTNSATAFIQFNRDYQLNGGRTMRIDQGGQFSSTSYVDIGALGDGTLVVDSSASRFTAGTALISGEYSDWGNLAKTADVTISNSAQARYMNGLQIGVAGINSTGRLHLNSLGLLTVDNFLTTGGTGTADLTINNANLTSNGNAAFGNHSTIALQNNGSINFNGDGTFLTGSALTWTSGQVNVAAGKSLNVNGGVINNTFTGLAIPNGSTYRVLNGGQFNNISYVDVANGAATGTLLVDGAGSKLTANSSISDWGANVGNNATVTFSNAGAGTYSIIRMSALGGSATLNLQTNGVLNTGGFQAGTGTGTSPLSRINISGGTLSTTGVGSFSGGANVNLSGGGLVLGGGTTFATGATLNQTGGTFVMPMNNFLAFDGGVGTISTNLQPAGNTLRVTNGGKLAINGYLYAGNAGTGTFLIDGSASSFTIVNPNAFSVFGNGGNASADVTISNGGIADFSGHPQGIILAASGATARLNVLSNGKLNVFGLSNTVNPGVATVTVSGGGIVTTGASNFAGNGSAVNLQAGSIVFGDGTFQTGTAFNWSGGTMSVGNGKSLTFDGGVGTVTAGGRGLSNAATLKVINGGQFTSNNYFDIGSSADVGNGPTGSLLVQGFGSRYVQTGTNAPFWSYAVGDSATIIFASGAAGTLSAGANLGTNGGKGLVQVFSGASLYLAGLNAGGGAGTNTSLINVATGGTLTVAGDAALSRGAELDYTSGGVLVTGVVLTQNNAKVVVTSGPNKVLRVGGLQMFNTSKVDLWDNDMIIGSLSTTASSVRGYLASGYNFGNFDGIGISSTAARNNPNGNTTLGMLTGNEYFNSNGATSFDGVTVNAGDILIKYTYFGDVDFNGAIDSTDYNLIDFGFLTHASGWANGDVDYSGAVDSTDYNLIDFAFVTQNGFLRRAIAYLDGSDRSAVGMNDASLQEVVQHFEQFGNAYAAGFLSNVPEPTTSAIGVAMLTATIASRRIRRRAMSNAKR